MEPYVLSKSIILDSRAITYIYNDRTYFSNFEEANSEADRLYAGDSVLSIEGYRIVEIEVIYKDRSVHKIKLLKTTFIPSFYINVISLYKFTLQGVY